MASMAALKAGSFALDGLLKPLILRTNCRDAARTSSGVTGGSKLKSILMLRHIAVGPLGKTGVANWLYFNRNCVLSGQRGCRGLKAWRLREVCLVGSYGRSMRS